MTMIRCLASEMTEMTSLHPYCLHVVDFNRQAFHPRVLWRNYGEITSPISQIRFWINLYNYIIDSLNHHTKEDHKVLKRAVLFGNTMWNCWQGWYWYSILQRMGAFEFPFLHFSCSLKTSITGTTLIQKLAAWINSWRGQAFKEVPSI
jgi:hypothetical protein